jgi:hypothetical protein
MAYELLYSRNRSTDTPVVFETVEVPQASLMIDVLSVLSQFRRSAGWLYPVRPTGTGSYERGEGRLLLFGKTRVIFNDFTPPYYLEFFPRFGVGKYILSVYTGDPTVTRPASLTFPAASNQIYRDANTGQIWIAADENSPFIALPNLFNTQGAFVTYDSRVFIYTESDTYIVAQPPDWVLQGSNSAQWDFNSDPTNAIFVPTSS